MPRLLSVLLLSVLVLSAVVAEEPTPNNAAAVARMKKDLTFLASKECEGRGANTKGQALAAQYIADQFKAIGLKPGNKDSYFQPYAIAGSAGKLKVTGPDKKVVELKQDADFCPLGLDQLGTGKGEVVFVGYGVTCANPAYDDYAGIDVKGKIVVALRDTPRATAKDRTAAMRNAGSLTAKVTTAAKNGAAGLILVNDADTAADGDAPLDYSFTRLVRGGKNRTMPAAFATRALVEKMLPKGKTLAGIEKNIDKTFAPESVPLTGWEVELSAQTRRDQIPHKNVIGYLEGSGPLADETVVVGAHYDHLGYGGPSSLAPGKKRQIHFGADDNGSGTTAMLEVARRYAAMKDRQGRRLVFIAFSGEELGLFGSKHYCAEPLFPLAKTAAMFNLDMVGRLKKNAKGEEKILTEGHGTAKGFKELIDGVAKKYGVTLSSKASGFGPSDHDSFASKKIPVLFFWTGTHDQYHRPTDTVDLIAFDGMAKMIDIAVDVVTPFTKMDKPAFVEVKGGGGTRPAGGGVRMGIRPGYEEGVEGVKVEGVGEGGAAAKAGIKAEDRIVKIGDTKVANIEGYMAAMKLQKPGGTAEVVVIRGGKEVKIKVLFDKE